MWNLIILKLLPQAPVADSYDSKQGIRQADEHVKTMKKTPDLLRSFIIEEFNSK